MVGFQDGAEELRSIEVFEKQKTEIQPQGDGDSRGFNPDEYESLPTGTIDEDTAA